ncbi:endoplasmic reticulum protein [Rhizophagus clarus]|uniref:Endoplasmic reticulum protein n=1 Tax=Rhizophagus clarus TaxID=94130 RepID=A0A8H3LJV0_9GLOM|nr:endoplasmic reticulum protein [Rhizophagus clarus]
MKFDDVSSKDLLNSNSTNRDDSSYHKFGWLRVTKEFDLPNNGSNKSTFGMMKQGITSFMEGSSNNKNNKRMKDSYFAVLKYNTLFMYDSERQLDCKVQ